MKLNINCIRDVLLELENFPMGVYCVQSFQDALSKYETDDVIYSLYKLSEAKYINAITGMTQDGRPHINAVYDITFQGHEFLANIKPKKNWEKLSSALKQIGSASFEVLSSAALGLATDSIKVALKF